MNKKASTLIVACLLGASLITGCVKLTVKTEVASGAADGSIGTPGRGGTTGSPTSVSDTTMADMVAQAPPATPTNPSGNGDTLPIVLSSFSNNTALTGCFTASQGWDKYYPLQKLLVGPNTALSTIIYPNIDNLASATVSTLNVGNPLGLETAIVIYPEYAPWDRSCGNTPNACESLTRVPTVAGVRYKATVFYKSQTLPAGTPQINVRWSYP